MNSLAPALNRCGSARCGPDSAWSNAAQPASDSNLHNPHCGSETSWLSRKATRISPHPTGGTRLCSSNPPAMLIRGSNILPEYSHRQPSLIGGRGFPLAERPQESGGYGRRSGTASRPRLSERGARSPDDCHQDHLEHSRLLAGIGRNRAGERCSTAVGASRATRLEVGDVVPREGAR